MSDGLLWHRIPFAFTVTYHYPLTSPKGLLT